MNIKNNNMKNNGFHWTKRINIPIFIYFQGMKPIIVIISLMVVSLLAKTFLIETDETNDKHTRTKHIRGRKYFHSGMQNKAIVPFETCHGPKCRGIVPYLYTYWKYFSFWQKAITFNAANLTKCLKKYKKIENWG